MKRRSIVLFDDWSKGANTRDKLLPEGVSARIENFTCDRKGSLEKGLPFEVISTPAEDEVHWFDEDTIHRVFYWYAKDKDYQVYLANIGGDAKIAIHDGTNWMSWKASDHFFHWVDSTCDLEDVIFLSSLVGGIPCLRVYPIYPSTTDLDEWVPLRIFPMDAFDIFEDTTETKYANGDSFNSKVAVFGDNIVECACGHDGALQPCAKVWGNCAYDGVANSPDPDERTEFTALVSGIFAIPFLLSTHERMLCERLETSSDFELIVSRPIFRDEYTQDTAKQGTEFWTFGSSSNEEQAEINMICLKGLPSISSSLVASQITIISSPVTAQYMVPAVVMDCQYEGGEVIDYGFSFVTFDGQYGRIEVVRYGITVEEFSAGPDASPQKGFVQIFVSRSVFPSTLSGEIVDRNMAKAITGLAIWRKNDTDGEWKLLDIVQRKVIEPDEKINTRDCNPIILMTNATRMHSTSILGNAASFLTSYHPDWGQACGDNIYSATGGLEEEDLGVEVGIRAPALGGRKIYAGNVLKLKQWDSTWEPAWSDDEILPSIIDAGEMFPGSEYLEVVSGESDLIKRIIIFGRQMIVMKRSYVIIMSMIGQSEGAWKVVSKLSGGVGDYYHVCETPFGPVWLSDEHLYMWDGKQRRPLSIAFQDEYRAMYGSWASTMSVGFDGHTSKIYVGRSGADKLFIIDLRSGAYTSQENGQDCQYRGYCNDLTGRLVGTQVASFARYIEAKEIDLSTGERTIGEATWDSGSIDLIKLVGEAKLYNVYVYLSYKRKDSYSGTHDLQLKGSFDGAAQITYTYTLPSGTQEDTIVATFDVWNQGKVLELEFNTNEDTVEFDYFRIWKIVGTFGNKGVD